jgi:hypothetical protein
MLRPVSGGKEWQAQPDDIQLEVSEHPRPADVTQLRAAHRVHVAECETCTTDEPCDIGRVLALAVEETTRPAESAPQAEAS